MTSLNLRAVFATPLASQWARMRYTIVTLSALFMFWFYYYWNILGFQYA